MAGYMNAEQKERFEHIPDGRGNRAIQKWYENDTDRKQKLASPSSLTTCPRVQWLVNHDVPATSPMGWGLKQRMELGRILENDLAAKLANTGDLLVHFRDDPPMRECYPVPANTEMIVKQPDGSYKAVPGVPKFELKYKGTVIATGVPDYLLVNEDAKLVTTSDGKTSRADSFAYVPIENPWTDYGWWKYKIQVTCYNMMVNQSGFLESDVFKAWDGALPKLSKAANLVSYALDDGVVKRDIDWLPTEDDMKKVIAYAMRLNAGINSEVMPPCTCGDTPVGEWDGIPWATKFCRYQTMNNNFHQSKSGTKFQRECCSDDLAMLVPDAKQGELQV